MFSHIHILCKGSFFIRRVGFLIWWTTICLLASPSLLLSASFNLQLLENKLTVQAQEYPLEQALKEIAFEAGFKLVIHGVLTSTVDIKLVNSPLELSLRRLIGRHSMVVLFEKASEQEKVKEVWIFQHGGSNTFITEASAMERNGGYIVPRTIFIHDEESDDTGEVSTEEDYNDVSRLKRAILQEEDINKLEFVVRELAVIGTEESVQTMAQALEKPDPGLRRYVAEQLGQVDALNAVLVLGQIVLGEKDPLVRLEAVKSLAEKNSPAATAFLKSATQDEDSAIRKTAANAL